MSGTMSIGTCSWKYDSWQGLLYPEGGISNYLREYARHYTTVEVDQWFWSLFTKDNPILPKSEVVREYAESVPADFVFCIKVPNSITLTHHYKKRSSDPLTPNPHFFSAELMQQFLDRLAPLSSQLGPLIFQFEYLSKQKMSSQVAFLDRLEQFVEHLPQGYTYCIETRNPNYLNSRYFDFLAGHGLYHVFLQGYYLPPIFEVYAKYKDHIRDLTVIRLHGPDRKGIEEQTGGNWNQIVSPKDQDIEKLSGMLHDLAARCVRAYVYVNNHFEGSAPRTITRIHEILGR